MDPNLKEALKGFDGEYREDELLSTHTWYRIGGPCRAYCQPSNEAAVKNLVALSRENGIPYLVLGKGTNILIGDKGWDGIVIDLSEACKSIMTTDAGVVAGAGVPVPKLVLACERSGLGGIEVLAGIPGTLGGAIKMNAGCHGQEIFDCLDRVEVILDGQAKSLTKSEIEFGYRHVRTFEAQDCVVLGAKLNLRKENAAELEQTRKHFMEIRRNTQPLNLPSSGSVFKNPAGDHAARLIEACGLKGRRIGEACISDKHANFIVNLGNAKADDVLNLIELARNQVVQRFGIKLETEVQLIGFDS